MHRTLLLLGLFLCPIIPFAQANQSEVIYKRPVRLPTFGDCGSKNEAERRACTTQTLHRFVKKYLEMDNIRVDRICSEPIIVAFIIEKDGSVSNVRLLKDNCKIGRELVRLLYKMPRWSNGTARQRARRIVYHLPLRLSFE